MKCRVLLLLSMGVLLAVHRSSALPSQTVITSLQPVIIAGIDRIDNPQGSRAMLLLEEASSLLSVESNASGSKLLTADGDTPASAFDLIQRSTIKHLPYGTIECFILGESVLKDDLLHYIDYWSKDNELRLISPIFAMRGCSAETALTLVAQNEAANVLESLNTNSETSTVAHEMEFVQFIEKLCDPTACFTLPCLVVTDDKSVNALIPNGYALITRGHFTTYLDPIQSSVYHLLTNQPGRFTMQIPVQGTLATTIVENAHTQVECVFEGDTLRKIILNLEVNSDALDTYGVRNMAANSTMQAMNKAQEALLYKQCSALLKLAQENASDFLGLSEHFRLLHPYRWNKVQDDWPTIFAQTEIELNVVTHVRHSFDTLMIAD